MASMELQVTERWDGAALVQIVLDAVDSPHTKRAYERALNDFLAWVADTGAVANRATVQRYVAELKSQGVGASSINQRLSAIKTLTKEAAANGAIPDDLAAGIGSVKGIRQEGQRLGNWLSRTQAQSLLNTPDTATVKGLRDRAIIAVLLGCGLRRQEAAALEMGHLQQREGRWVVVDLVGKRNKTRSVPMPGWCKQAVDAWTTAAGITTGRIFRSMVKGDVVSGASITAQTIYDVLKEYSQGMGLLIDVAPHDLRRTFAQLARKGGAALEQIQLSLGHGSIVTTEKYLGTRQDLTDAPGDRLGLRL